jgi:tRNA (mo5U34)-methyltransferase
VQSVDLGCGVVTPGLSDSRHEVPSYGLPTSLAGTRALDFGTFDGFWAFELERRGASVTALDLVDGDVKESLGAIRGPAQRPMTARRAGFRLAREHLKSNVSLVEASAYAVEAEGLGRFDVVLISDVLRHLRCPQRALEQAVSVCDGELFVADVVDPALEGLGDLAMAEYKTGGTPWWLPNSKTLANMMMVAGCEPVEEVARFDLEPDQSGLRLQKVVLRGRVDLNPLWLREWCRTAAQTPPKWRSAAEREQ